MIRALTEFIDQHRNSFAVSDGNIFALSFGKVTRHLIFLEIIRQRYKDASYDLVANSKAFHETIKSPGTHTLSPEQIKLQQDNWHLSNLVHLEIESYYLFAKILLDEIAHAVENYFGPVRSLSLDSHDDFSKNYRAYASAKYLTNLDDFENKILDLRRRISDFRDQQIAHEKSPRTLRGAAWGPTGEVMLSTHRLYPKETDIQVNSETLSSLATGIETYIEDVIALIKMNQPRTRFNLAHDDR